MNLLHLSRADIEGGAAQATYQIHSLLQDAGHRSVMAVRRKASSDAQVLFVGAKSLWRSTRSELTERIRSRLAGGYQVEPNPIYYFNRNLAPIPDWDTALAEMPQPDVLFLHWVTHLTTAADIRRLAERVRCPIVWVLMDMEPLTGGCHYPGDCIRFQGECRDCPQLQKDVSDWAGRTWREKRKQLSDLPITFLAPTQWVAERVGSSGLFRNHPIERIPLPISPRMRPLDKTIARQILGWPLDKKIILAGSFNLNDPRKGGGRLVAAARLLAAGDDKKSIQFVVVGTHGSVLAKEIPFPVHEMGYQGDIVLPLIYQAADVFACSSMEDAGPMMVSQAMLCETPVVAFNTGIVPELLASGRGGYMARLGDAEDFARGLKNMLDADESEGRHAFEVASHYHDGRKIAQAYEEMLNRLVSTSKEATAP